MNTKTLIDQTKIAMQKAMDHLLLEFKSLNTGKANPAVVENISVNAYGSTMKLREVAAITTPDARTIRIQAWDKGLIREVEKAIQSANIGLNPLVDGDILRCPIPELSRERRQEMGKVAHGMAEQGRIAIRSARRDSLDSLKKAQKDGLISEDDAKRAEKEIQQLTDKFNKDIATQVELKEKELLQI